MSDSNDKPDCKSSRLDAVLVKLTGVYVFYLGFYNGKHHWLVDPARVKELCYRHWCWGGHHLRYDFNSKDEIWVDKDMGPAERHPLEGHEGKEEPLMQQGWPYERAHNASLDWEVPWRQDDLSRTQRQERIWRKSLPKALRKKLKGPVYRSDWGIIDGFHVWIVHGGTVMRDLSTDGSWDFNMGGGDFNMAGSYYTQTFIPDGEVEPEIWLSAEMSLERALYELHHHITYYKLRRSGMDHDEALEQATQSEAAERRRQKELCREHEAKLPPVPLGVRDHGVKSS